MSGACDKDISRLINVAMTRAKRRLVVIGNFSWFTSKGRGALSAASCCLTSSQNMSLWRQLV